MSKAQHTPEPWPPFTDIATAMTPDPDGTPVAILSWDDYIRARACVNALEGLNDYALIGGWSFRGSEAYSKGLEQQRDELLTAAETLLSRKRPEQTEDDPRLILEVDCMALEEIVERIKSADYRNPGNTACITTGK
jgi:hypothetical protein